MLLKGVLNSSSKLREILPAQVKVTLESIETLAEQNLNIMLNDLENEWKVTITEIPNEGDIDKLLEEATKKAEELKAKEQIQQKEKLRDDIELLIIEGTDILQGFKAILTAGDKWPITEFNKWRDRVFEVLDKNKLDPNSTLFFKDVYIKDEEIAALHDFIQACTAGLNRLEEIVKSL